MSPRVQIVVNPGSGDGRAVITARRLAAALGERGYRADLLVFHDLRGLEHWARTCSATFSHLACVGGDATLSATAAAAMRFSVPLIPVPQGFGNIFAGAFAHPRHVEATARLMREGVVRGVDVGMAGDEMFLCHRSYGLLDEIERALVSARAVPASRLARHLAYYGLAARILVEQPLRSIRVDLDERTIAERAAVVTVANVETYRGFLSLTPHASPTDGLFDVVAMPRTTKPRLLGRLLRVMLHLPRHGHGVVHARGRRVTVSVDGGAREELRVLPHALPVLAPAASLATLTPHEQARARLRIA